MNSKSDKIIEELKSDIVCIGAGGTGLAAAVAAAEKGAKVIVLEKRNAPGGNTARAQGFFAAESPTQKRLKIEAPKDILYKMAMDYAHWKIDPRIISAFIDKSGDTVRWLEEKGLEIKEIWPLFPAQVIRTMHYPKGGGEGITDILIKSCEEFGVRIFYQTVPNKILMNTRGEVSGIEATSKEKGIKISAKGVIIATGGYGGNKELLMKYCPAYIGDTLSPGLKHMGDGILLATEVGAANEGLGPVFEGIAHGPGIWKEPDMIWVNKRGERFADEAAGLNHFESVHAVLRQPGNISYSVFDELIKSNIAEKIEGGYLPFRGLASRPKIGKSPDLSKELEIEAAKGKVSDSWDEIADWIGASPEVLKSTVEEYNFYCDHGYDSVFRKDRRYLYPLRTPPYYALRCHANFLSTIGGIKINHHMQVLNHDGNPIPGLYAGGNDTGGWEAENTYNAFLSGHAMGFAINSGRIAGENATKYSLRT